MQELPDKRTDVLLLLHQERLQPHFPRRDVIQHLLPQRSGARIFQRFRQGVNQCAGGIRGQQKAALLNQITALKESLDNPGAGGFSANTGVLFQPLLQAFIADKACGIFHRGNQRPFRVVLWWLSLAGANVHLFHLAGLPLLQGGKCLRFFR